MLLRTPPFFFPVQALAIYKGLYGKPLSFYNNSTRISGVMLDAMKSTCSAYPSAKTCVEVFGNSAGRRRRLQQGSGGLASLLNVLNSISSAISSSNSQMQNVLAQVRVSRDWCPMMISHHAGLAEMVNRGMVIRGRGSGLLGQPHDVTARTILKLGLSTHR
jgi:hypothetical protein